MSNPFGFVLDSGSVRWAAAEGVSETVIAAILLLDERRSLSEILPALTAAEVEQLIKLVGRCPRGYPPGALDELKRWKSSLSPPPSQSAPTNLAAKEQSERPHTAHQLPWRPKRVPPRVNAPGDAPPSSPSAPTNLTAKEQARRTHLAQLLARRRKRVPPGVSVPGDAPPRALERGGTSDETGRAAECASSAGPRWKERINKKCESGIFTGAIAGQTARRRLVVEDLMKADLSVRMISQLTEIPRSSVHRAKRAIVRAEAKKELAILETASKLLGKRLAHRGRATRTSKKRERTTSKCSKTSHGQSAGSPKKLAENFFAELGRSFEQHGHETIAQVRTERPELYVKTLLKLTQVLHRAPGNPNDFDRQRTRKDILQRLEQRRM